MKILFVGESWLGSCARSLKEALLRMPGLELDELNEDLFFPKPRARWLRGLNRMTHAAYRRELAAAVMTKIEEGRPDAVIVYKGNGVRADLVRRIRDSGVFALNVYPDCSPHAHGQKHRVAVGTYDLVISSKAYHPGLWREFYGYENQCVFVPQGYDVNLHLRGSLPSQFDFDVAMVATYRPEYGRLISELAKFPDVSKLKIAIGGYGWHVMKSSLPAHWYLPGAVHGRAYISLLRKAKICVAPLTREVVINGQNQPGDVDTTRSYELAAAHCFFIHRRTDFAQQLYSANEVPMFDDALELAGHIRDYLPNPALRARMAEAAHLRAVPAYSLDARASAIVNIIADQLERRS